MTVHSIAAGVHATLMRRALAILSIALFVLATPFLVNAQGAGTEWLACRDDATIDMGICYLNADRYWDKFRCNLAWELDLWGCNADLVDALNPIF